MNPLICIDFGSAYTKIGIRCDVNKPSQLVTDEALVLDAGRFCVPTLAAKAERSGKVHWEFGPHASTLTNGNGITVYRHWKSKLFGTAEPRKKKSLTLVAAGNKAEGNQLSQSLATKVTGSTRTDPEIRDVASKFFAWLLTFLRKPCARLGLRDIGSIPVRLNVPAFGTNRERETRRSVHEQALLDILAEVGWCIDEECPIVTEPESNAIGIYTEGKNSIWKPRETTQSLWHGTGPSRRGNVSSVQMGPPKIHLQNMFKSGAYLAALKHPRATAHRVLVIDVGAFTTDLALIEFDLNIDALLQAKRPRIECRSNILGVQDLDKLVQSRLPSVKAMKLENLEARRREELRRSIYSDAASYRLDANVSIGAGDEAKLVRNCINEFANRIADSVEEFVREQNVSHVLEVLLTGGGTMIPRLCSELRSRILRMGLGTKVLHSSSTKTFSNDSDYCHCPLDVRLVRGASGIGGASVYFEQRFW